MSKAIILLSLLGAMTCGLSAQTKPKASSDTAQEAAVVLSCAACGCVFAFKPLDAVQFLQDAQK